ncbi:hypothetical protein KC336_g76 [Hortaea werneckii]|nr:hypothetical protein KC336_g76 [Hortaea werneckii]
MSAGQRCLTSSQIDDLGRQGIAVLINTAKDTGHNSQPHLSRLHSQSHTDESTMKDQYTTHSAYFLPRFLPRRVSALSLSAFANPQSRKRARYIPIPHPGTIKHLKKDVNILLARNQCHYHHLLIALEI